MEIRKKPKKEADLAATGQVMTPDRLAYSLSRIIEVPIRLSVMIWGAPGIGKSSIVAKVAQDAGIGIVDLRLSQLAPTDLRGLPAGGAILISSRNRMPRPSRGKTSGGYQRETPPDQWALLFDPWL